MKFKDYYDVLGVDRKAKAEEIRRAYRQLARKYHPDVNKTDPSAEDRFKEINEAYEVLKDPEKRGHYDQLGQNWKAGQDFRPPPGWEAHFGGGAPGNGGGSGFDFGGFSDFFEALFGGRAGGPSPSGTYTTQGGFPFETGPGFGGQHARRVPEATEAELEVTIEDVIRGGTISIALSPPGRGRRTYNVRIPAGIREGKKIRLAGEGESGTDLLLKVRYASDRRWQRDGTNLVTTVEIKPSQAALGDKVSVQAPDGELTVKVPAGSSSGRKLRVRGHGLPTEGGGRGDLLVEIAIVLPAELSDDEKKLFEALRDAGL